MLYVQDFESEVWDSALVVYDENPASGEDYWGLTDYVAHDGHRSAAAAGAGTNSADGLPNLMRVPTDSSWIARYDTNMSASMDLDVSSSSESQVRYVVFHYAAFTEAWLVDYLTLFGLNGTRWQTLWTQNVTVTLDFYRVNVSIPLGVRWISWHFYSDADNASFPGVFVDDIALYGSLNLGQGDVSGRTFAMLIGAMVLVAAAGTGFGFVLYLMTKKRGGG